MRLFCFAGMAMRASQKCAADQIWPAGQGLRTAVLDTELRKWNYNWTCGLYGVMAIGCSGCFGVEYSRLTSDGNQVEDVLN